MTTAGFLLAGETPASSAGGGFAGSLDRTSPQEVGIDPAGILRFIDGVEKRVGGLHSFMLLRHGKVAAEGWWAPYKPAYPHMLFSLSKSFTSTAVGFAVAEKRLTVEAPVTSFFPDLVPARVDENMAAMRVKHLLMMSTGHDQDATNPVRTAADGDWAKKFLSLPVEHAPGSKFVYNSAATYMLSAIVQKLTGMTALDYLTPRLFDPLGIRGATWEKCPKGINTGGWGLAIKTEDIARFGQCYLDKGRWNGRQVVPAAWVAEATTKHISNGSGDASDWTQGYCYQFWRCRHNAVRGDGAFGQYCVMMPDQDAVLAITSGVGDMQAVLDCAWDHLLPAMRDDSHIHDDGSSLQSRLESLSVPSPVGRASSPAGRGKTYRLEPNEEKLEAVSFRFDGPRTTLAIRGTKGESKIEAGADRWIGGTAPLALPLAANPSARIGARGTWTSPDTYTATICYVETPFVETVRCRFADDGVTVDRQMNVSFGPAKMPTLTGRTG